MNTKTCGCCDTSRSNNQFYKSPIDGKFLPICKTCTNEKLRKYTKEMGNDCAGFWLVLAELGIPFLKDYWIKVESLVTAAGNNRRPDLVLAYLRFLNEENKKVNGFWESDVMLDMLVDSAVVREETEFLDLNEQKKIWGKFATADGQLDIESYTFLNETFEDYTKDLLDLDANLEKRYRDLAKAELRKRKADESGDIQEIKNAQSILNSQLSLLKLNEFKSHQKTDEQLAFEKRVAMIEYTKPSECEDLKVYLDMVGYEKDKGILMRSLRNAIAGTRDYPEIPKEELG